MLDLNLIKGRLQSEKQEKITLDYKTKLLESVTSLKVQLLKL